MAAELVPDLLSALSLRAAVNAWGPGSLVFPDGSQSVAGGPEKGKAPREHAICKPPPARRFRFFRAEGPSAPQLTCLLGGLGS